MYMRGYERRRACEYVSPPSSRHAIAHRALRQSLPRSQAASVDAPPRIVPAGVSRDRLAIGASVHSAALALHRVEYTPWDDLHPTSDRRAMFLKRPAYSHDTRVAPHVHAGLFSAPTVRYPVDADPHLLRIPAPLVSRSPPSNRHHSSSDHLCNHVCRCLGVSFCPAIAVSLPAASMDAIFDAAGQGDAGGKHAGCFASTE